MVEIAEKMKKYCKNEDITAEFYDGRDVQRDMVWSAVIVQKVDIGQKSAVAQTCFDLKCH